MMYMHVHYPEWTRTNRADFRWKTLDQNKEGYLRHLRRRGHGENPDRKYLQAHVELDELASSNFHILILALFKNCESLFQRNP